MKVIDEWKNLTLSQFYDKPVLWGIIRAISETLQEAYKEGQELRKLLDIDSQEGVNLDHIGDIVCLTRTQAHYILRRNNEFELTDNLYRNALKYKIMLNNSNATYYDIIEGIRIIWNIGDIMYQEDANRPATILIRLQKINVDSDVDPAADKTLVVKPAGVALIYTADYIVIIDSSRQERFLHPRLNMHTIVPYWTPLLLNGTWLCDGSWLLDSQRHYTARPGVMVWGIEFETIESVRGKGMAISFLMKNVGQIQLPAITMFFQMNFLDIAYLETVNRMTYRGISTEEEFDNFNLIKRKNLWYFDGSFSLDGSNILNAKIEMEDI